MLSPAVRHSSTSGPFRNRHRYRRRRRREAVPGKNPEIVVKDLRALIARQAAFVLPNLDHSSPKPRATSASRLLFEFRA